jgi:hypothetical protein
MSSRLMVLGFAGPPQLIDAFDRKPDMAAEKYRLRSMLSFRMLRSRVLPHGTGGV